MSERKKKKRGSPLAAVFAVAAVACAVIGILLFQKSRGGGEDPYTAIRGRAETPVRGMAAGVAKGPSALAGAATHLAEAAAEAARALPEEPPEEIPIDFETLWETCPEAYAWIRIDNTRIDYPICQKVEGDQGFYLNHRSDGTPEFAGSIYSENYNKRDFTDPVTVLYGHDMSDGSMFQNLHLYEDRAFFDQNRDVTIYLPTKVLHYRVFAAYNTDDGHVLVNNGFFEDPAVFYSYLQGIFSQRSMSGFVDQNVELTPESRILTMSTCNAYENQRYLVQCVLLNPSAVTTVIPTQAPQ